MSNGGRNMVRITLVAVAVLAVGACGGGSTTTNTTTTGNGAASLNQPAPAAIAPVPPPASANIAVNTAAPASAADAELAAIEWSNAEEATAEARGISSEKDPDARAAACIVFLGISREQNSRNVGFDDVAMRQAQDQWKADLQTRMPEQEAEQFTGSSVNMLLPAAARERDAASAWCVRNAPEVDLEG